MLPEDFQGVIDQLDGPPDALQQRLKISCDRRHGRPLHLLRIRPQHRGKKHHGMNVQVLADPAGRLIWALDALPGAVHD
ncbi:hypothetical protein [Streptomyces halstedii]|uniref:hypothetical protein n=1 Tax=Streptomyces halstedii TaxID=1944 RepID=UPI003460D9C6